MHEFNMQTCEGYMYLCYILIYILTWRYVETYALIVKH